MRLVICCESWNNSNEMRISFIPMTFKLCSLNWLTPFQHHGLCKKLFLVRLNFLFEWIFHVNFELFFLDFVLFPLEKIFRTMNGAMIFWYSRNASFRRCRCCRRRPFLYALSEIMKYLWFHRKIQWTRNLYFF